MAKSPMRKSKMTPDQLHDWVQLRFDGNKVHCADALGTSRSGVAYAMSQDHVSVRMVNKILKYEASRLVNEFAILDSKTSVERSTASYFLNDIAASDAEFDLVKSTQRYVAYLRLIKDK